MRNIIFIILIMLAIMLGIIFGVGLWHFEKQAIYSREKKYDTTKNIEQSITDGTVSPTVLYFQTIVHELRALQHTLSSQRPFILLFK